MSLAVRQRMPCTVCSALEMKINSENKALLLTRRLGGIFQKWGPRSYWAPQKNSRGQQASLPPPVLTPILQHGSSVFVATSKY